MSRIDIKDLNKVELLQALWERQIVPPYSMGIFQGAKTEWTQDDSIRAEEAVKGYIDYFKGRVIKTDLSGDTVNPAGFDRDAGEGKFQSVVNRLRSD